MEWLNYHHLYYFWTVARAGSMTKASAELRLKQPTVSTQIKALEEMLGRELFERTGKHLSLTADGQLVLRYAEQIFGLGRELVGVMRETTEEKGLTLRVGIVDALPKSVAYKLLAPVLRMQQKVLLSCPEGQVEQLLAELAVHKLDLILADSSIPSGLNIKAFHQLLGESSISVFASAKLIRKLKGKFPLCLDRAPFLLPAQSGLRRGLEQWFDEKGIDPDIVGEFVDSALLNMFGRAGEGVFAAPTVLEGDMTTQYGLRVVGRITAIKERYFAISPARQTKHPAVAAIVDGARDLFIQ